MEMKTPPMGWNSWDCYGPAVDEATVRKNAEYMAKHLKSYGWEYIVVDIQWSQPTASSHEYHPFTELCMDEYSRLIPAENRFPSSAGGAGFKPLAGYVHSLGLKFGIHIMRGIPRQAVHRNTPILGSSHTAREIAKLDSICVWNTDMYGVNPDAPGAKEYYDSIFALYAEWGVDFIKCDDIAREIPKEESELILLSDSLKNCGRDMILSLSPGPALPERSKLYRETANMWRITDDFWDEWQLLYDMFERCKVWSGDVGAGHWPDADMLPIGALRQNTNPSDWTNFTGIELTTMINLWCIFRSPLMIGGELTKLDDFSLMLLSNVNVIEMNKYGRHAHQVWRRETDGTELVLWVSSRSLGGFYAGVFNIGEEEADVSVPLTDMEIYESLEITDLWSGKKRSADVIETHLAPHASSVYRLQ